MSTSVVSIPAGLVEIQGLSSGLVLDSDDKGGIVQQTKDDKKSTQRWRLTSVAGPERVYRIVRDDAGSVSALTAWNDGYSLRVRPLNEGSKAQQWVLHDTGNGYQFESQQYRDSFVSVKDDSQDPGYSVILWKNENGSNQQWRLVDATAQAYVTFPSNYVYATISAKHSVKRIDVRGSSPANNTDVIQYWGNDPSPQQPSDTVGDNMLFRFVPVGDGYCRIDVKHSKKALDVYDSGKGNDVKLIQYEWKNQDNQKFRVEPVGGGYCRIVAKHSGKVLSVQGASKDSGALVVQYDWQDGDHQKWRLG